MMKRFFLSIALAALSFTFLSCGKQQSEAERNAEVDRQVQQRLAAEHQSEAQQKLDQRQAALEAREQALAAKESATPAPAVAPNESETEADADSSATFYRKLDPYGDWMETSTYGYVFQPREAAQSNNWRPYTNGHWVYTDAGWT